MKNESMKSQKRSQNTASSSGVNLGQSVSKSIMEFMDKAQTPCNSEKHHSMMIEIPLVTLHVTQPMKSESKVFESDDNEDQMAIALGNFRLAKYRHDNGLPPLPEHPWFDSLMETAISNGLPNMFVPTPYQLEILIASNGTKISYQN